MLNDCRKTLRKTRAFTLVEMLVVITIMVILFGIMSPVMFPAKKRAAVESSAQKLVSVIYATRARAAAEGKAFGLAFNSDYYVVIRTIIAQDLIDNPTYPLVENTFPVYNKTQMKNQNVEHYAVSNAYNIDEGAKLEFRYDPLSLDKTATATAQSGDMMFKFLPDGSVILPSTSKYSSKVGIIIREDSNKSTVIGTGTSAIFNKGVMYRRIFIDQYTGMVRTSK